jgi:hypothetical protein
MALNKKHIPVRPEIEKAIQDIVKERGWTVEIEEWQDDFHIDWTHKEIFDCNGSKILGYYVNNSRISFNRFNLWCSYYESTYPYYLNKCIDRKTHVRKWIEAFLLPPVEKCKGNMELYDKYWNCGKDHCKKNQLVPGKQIKPFCSNRNVLLCGMDKCKRYELCTSLKRIRTVQLTADQIATGRR